METEKVLDFLRYGGDPTRIAALSTSCTAPFLPSFALLASDSLSFSSSLLASHPLAPSALAYASLDFSDISHAALCTLKRDPLLGDKHTSWDDSVHFHSADHKERVQNVIVCMHRRAEKFMRVMEVGKELDKTWHRHQSDAGSMWNNKSCLSELTCLLPIAAFRCPKLVLPEDLVWSLLPTQWGFVLLSYILLNNPVLVRQTLFLLSEFLRTHETSLISSGNVLASNNYAHMLPHQQRRHNLTMLHCVKQAVLTFLQLSKLSSSLAHMCREVLVKNSASPGIAVYLTAEYIHDGFDFVSRTIFSDTKTSEWMLGYFRGAKKDYLESLIHVIESVEILEGLFFLSAAKSDSTIGFQGGTLRIHNALLAEAQVTKQNYGWCGRLHGHLRLYTVVIRAAELQPMPEELEFWLQSLIDAEGSICEQTMKLGVAFLCLVPGLTANPVIRTLFYKCVAVLLRQTTLGEARFASVLGEQVVWFAVQLFLRHFSAIAVAVREVIGMDITVQNVSIQGLYDAAVVVQVISEPKTLMEAVVALRPKGPLSSKAEHGHYTLECLEQLLKSGHLSRNGVEVSEAVSHLISVSTTPIDGLLIKVIQAYTESPVAIVYGSKGSDTFRMRPLPRSFLEDSLVTIPSLTSDLERNEVNHGGVETGPETLVREALVSYYMLCRERVLRKEGTGSSLTAIYSPPDCEESWWAALLNRILFHQLPHHMENRHSDFVHMYPQWLSLAAKLFPERLLVPDLLASIAEPFTWAKNLSDDMVSDTTEASIIATLRYFNEGSYLSQERGTPQAQKSGVMLSIPIARMAIEDALVNPLSAVQLLDHLNLKSNSSQKKLSKELIDYQVFIVRGLVPKLLDPACHPCLQEKFRAWFKNLWPLVMQKLLPVFVDVISDTSLESDGVRLVLHQLKSIRAELNISRIQTFSDLVQQPLILLACKLRVFRTPLVSTVLDALHELRTVNRRVCIEVVSAEGMSREQTLTSEEVSSALLAQDSAMCQILLEVCLPNVRSGNDLESGPLLKARKIICGFLAPILESNDLLLKLIHFQGYDRQLLSMMVKGVPAMVRCLKFMPDFLQQQHRSKQIFTINAIASIACIHVDLPESVAAVKKAVSHVRNACGTSSFMQGVLSAMAECACTFSVVAADVVNIIQDCMKLCGPSKAGHSPSDPMLYSAALSAFNHLAQRRVTLGPL